MNNRIVSGFDGQNDCIAIFAEDCNGQPVEVEEKIPASTKDDEIPLYLESLAEKLREALSMDIDIDEHQQQNGA